MAAGLTIAIERTTNPSIGLFGLWCLMPLFNNISVISWRPVLLPIWV